MKEPSNWSELQKETRPQLVDKLLLHVRTDNFDAFCSAVDRGLSYYGQDKLTHIMHNDLMKQICACGELDNFLKWEAKFNDV